MNRETLVSRIRSSGSYLCVGLDSELERLPRHLMRDADPQFSFNRQIIDATLEHCVAYKINTAFYESLGARGWETMARTVQYIPKTHLTIADAKRGDIGNTSTQYARAFFDTLGFDAVTVAPYMGADSIQPFMAYKDKWTIVLGLTSNPGAADFELLETSGGLLFEQVMASSASWGTSDNTMFVVGATRADRMAAIRKDYPHHFFLVPGVGAQGGSLVEIAAAGLITEGGLLVNASRAIIFASAAENFAGPAREAAAAYHAEMRRTLIQ